RDEDGSSVKSALSFDPTPDAQVLYKAMKGFGTDEQAIIDVLTKRSNAQRQQIARSFKEQFGKDLITSLQSELSGKFERLLVALMYPPFKYDAKELHDAVKGERDDPRCYVDSALVLQDAQALYAAGEKIRGTDEIQFITVLCTRSATHLLRVFDEYQKLANKSLEDSIRSETHGSLEDAMLAIVKCTRNIHAYFAERLYHALKGAGTRDGTLIRVIVSRSEIDLNLIKAEFLKIAGKSLSTMIV
uniref:Annexin n=1 Tax=Pelusios castaneus TaxID=367368 RepID=A0A8C8RPF3_9SAUR